MTDSDQDQQLGLEVRRYDKSVSISALTRHSGRSYCKRESIERKIELHKSSREAGFVSGVPVRGKRVRGREINISKTKIFISVG